MKWFIKCFKQYADFSGRASRKEFWMYVSFNLIFLVLCLTISLIIDDITKTTIAQNISNVIVDIYLIGIFIPSLAVTVRRLHDVGFSGWLLISGLAIIFVCIKGNSGTNKYGPNPKELETFSKTN
jgi:uncharacterized membrane protein YhaH (DUF805 family)